MLNWSCDEWGGAESRGNPGRKAGFGHQCNEDYIYGKKEAGTGEHLTHLIIIKTNTNEKRQPLTEDCRTQNTN